MKRVEYAVGRRIGAGRSFRTGRFWGCDSGEDFVGDSIISGSGNSCSGCDVGTTVLAPRERVFGLTGWQVSVVLGAISNCDIGRCVWFV